MKYVLSGILFGAVAVTAGVVIGEQLRRQRKFEDVAELTDRLAKQLESLEMELTASKESFLAEVAPSTNGSAKRKVSKASVPPQS